MKVSTEYDRVREIVYRRDGYRCLLAGKQAGACLGGLTLHHVRKRSQGGSDVPANLVTLCEAHNGLVEDFPGWAHQVGLVERAGDRPGQAMMARRATGLNIPMG